MSQSEFLLNAIDQIWALYKKKPPNGIILIGHSMGGIIIQTTLLNKEVDLNKIAFVLSFATPYAEARNFKEKYINSYLFQLFNLTNVLLHFGNKCTRQIIL